MTILAIILLIMALPTGYFVATRGFNISKPSINSTRGLSPPAKQIVKEYNRLPADSRPFPDIIQLVKSIDAKHALDAQERDDAFNNNVVGIHRFDLLGYDFTWNKGSGYGKFGEYHRLHEAIKQVQDALDSKERAMLESRHKPDLSMIDELETLLRSEAQIQNEVTRELKELS